MNVISPADLILNPDGSIYHLHLLPGDISDTIILVGDPGRVHQVSSHFDSVEIEKTNREFLTHTGLYKGKRISVLSTGIGTDNIDIVLNELDAVVNVDLNARTVRNDHKEFKLIRIGTSGAIQPDIKPGSFIMTRIAGGFDGLYHFYKDDKHINLYDLAGSFMHFTGWKKNMSDPYFVKGSDHLLNLFPANDFFTGITLSTPGFYAPQIRTIRLTPFDTMLIQKLSSFNFDRMRINNFEMESSALYSMAALLGHEAATLCVAVANRITHEFLLDYKPVVDKLIIMTLDKLAIND